MKGLQGGRNKQISLKSIKECQSTIGQMSLVAMIEDEFGIELDPDEVMQFTSFEAGKNILKNHNIEL